MGTRSSSVSCLRRTPHPIARASGRREQTELVGAGGACCTARTLATASTSSFSRCQTARPVSWRRAAPMRHSPASSHAGTCGFLRRQPPEGHHLRRHADRGAVVGPFAHALLGRAPPRRCREALPVQYRSSAGRTPAPPASGGRRRRPGRRSSRGRACNGRAGTAATAAACDAPRAAARRAPHPCVRAAGAPAPPLPPSSLLLLPLHSPFRSRDAPASGLVTFACCPPPNEGSGAPRDAGCCETPLACRCERHAEALARRLASPCDRGRAPLGAPRVAIFGPPGPRFRLRHYPTERVQRCSSRPGPSVRRAVPVPSEPAVASHSRGTPHPAPPTERL